MGAPPSAMTGHPLRVTRAVRRGGSMRGWDDGEGMGAPPRALMSG